jgi:hypothetical protein
MGGVYLGPIDRIDTARRIIVVPTGEVVVPERISLDPFKPGMRVTLVYEREPNGRLVATELRLGARGL